MRALVYKGPKEIAVQDVPVPELKAQEVLIKVLYCGVCGTDRHIYSGEGGAFSVNPPLILGHEFSGLVVARGSAVHTVHEGDLVSANPNVMCGACYYCKNAMEQFCTSVIGLGTTVDGGFAEYCVVPEKQIYRFKAGTDPLLAAFCEPLSCCIHGVDLCHIKLADEVLIIGAGPIGLLSLQLVKLAGASKVYVSEPVPEKRALALKLGADQVLDPMSEDVTAILAQQTQRLSVVIECVGSIRTINNAINWVGHGGTVMLFGLTGPDAELKIKPDLIFKKELKITSSFINPYTFSRAGALLESGKIQVDQLVGASLPLEQVADILADPDYSKRGKIMVQLDTQAL